ncbi:MAG: FAD-dependent oxidoreductase [Dehalococcoidia bacterium]|nr:FAD-dependent oxidoreductase [Dehalococcoidia bacterium]
MKVAVVGAGLAGLAAACELTDLGHHGVVCARRPWAGGKTYSFLDRETGESVDNGQHVFMGCTTAYTGFLARLGTLALTKRQRRLRVPVFDAQGRRSDITAVALPGGLHLAGSFLRYRHLALADKLRAARLLAAVTRMPAAARDTLDGVAFGEWLRLHGQSESSIRALWDLVLVPTLNARADEVSAAAALFVLQEGFLKSAESGALGIPTVGLSALHVEPALAYVAARGGGVRLGCTVTRLQAEGEKVSSVVSSGGAEPFDAVVCAVPHRQVAALLPEQVAGASPFAELATIPAAPIVNVHVWFDRSVTALPFAAFAEGDLQWLFNRSRLEGRQGDGQHVVVSLSAAERWMALDKGALERHFVAALRTAFPEARQAQVRRCVVLKEPEATFVPAPGIRRPGARTPLANLYLAGAYTATGWPATMESAVRSGLAAARTLHSDSCRRAPAEATSGR